MVLSAACFLMRCTLIFQLMTCDAAVMVVEVGMCPVPLKLLITMMTASEPVLLVGMESQVVEQALMPLPLSLLNGGLVEIFLTLDQMVEMERSAAPLMMRQYASPPLMNGVWVMLVGEFPLLPPPLMSGVWVKIWLALE